MTGRSHALIGAQNVLATLLALNALDTSVIGPFVLGITSSLVPDIDANYSMLQRHIITNGNPKLANRLFSKKFRRSITGSLIHALASISELSARTIVFIPIMFIKLFTHHRGIIHSIPASIIMTLIVVVVSNTLAASKLYPITFIVGYITHLLLDSMTISGVRIFLPFSKKRLYLLPENYRIRTGSTEELYWVIGWSVITFLVCIYLTR